VLKITKHLLGNILLKKRKALGLTQAELAELCDISTRTVQVLEYGETWPGTDVLLKLAKALKTTTGEILNETDTSGPPHPHHEPNILNPSALDMAVLVERVLALPELPRALAFSYIFQNPNLLDQLHNADESAFEKLRQFMGIKSA
jgi:putative transcriptional regulator